MPIKSLHVLSVYPPSLRLFICGVRLAVTADKQTAASDILIWSVRGHLPSLFDVHVGMDGGEDCVHAAVNSYRHPEDSSVQL